MILPISPAQAWWNHIGTVGESSLRCSLAQPSSRMVVALPLGSLLEASLGLRRGFFGASSEPLGAFSGAPWGFWMAC